VNWILNKITAWQAKRANAKFSKNLMARSMKVLSKSKGATPGAKEMVLVDLPTDDTSDTMIINQQDQETK